MDATTLNSQAERFLAELHRSPQTVRAYRADLRHLTDWLRETGTVWREKLWRPTSRFIHTGRPQRAAGSRRHWNASAAGRCNIICWTAIPPFTWNIPACRPLIHEG